ncbi:CpsD/CapB family tyrosine-protein kinase [Ammoniphilus oxalaticus]|nr:CpsD/CapB family tyrosine-protein kinase [Ammoniphilus oxalaticus]
MFKPKRAKLEAWIRPHSVIAEQFRAIRENIGFTAHNQSLNSIAITSPQSGEGKSLIAANLAVSMSRQGQRVLLVDAHFKSPMIHTLFSLSNAVGLADVLRGAIGWEEATQQSELAGIDILTAGSLIGGSNEWLYPQAFRGWLSMTTDLYDVVLVDCPPIIDCADTQIIAYQVDGVILTLRRGVSDLARAEEAKNRLTLSKANILGVIFNDKDN